MGRCGELAGGAGDGRRGHGLLVARLRPCDLAAREESGQSSVEYALVVLAFLAALAALGLMWHAVRDGGLQRLSEQASSHAWSAGALGMLKDIALF